MADQASAKGRLATPAGRQSFAQRWAERRRMEREGLDYLTTLPQRFIYVYLPLLLFLFILLFPF